MDMSESEAKKEEDNLESTWNLHMELTFDLSIVRVCLY
jgi:hypothetical protein